MESDAHRNNELWSEANHRALSAALVMVRGYLARHAARVKGKAATVEESKKIEVAEQEFRSASASVSPSSALDLICTLFGLSRFERDALLVCAGLELDSSFTSLCARAQGDRRCNFATFGLMLAALPDAHWSALSPDRPLRRWRLIEFAASGGSSSAPLTTCPLRIDERVLHFLTGVHYVDERLASLVEPLRTLEKLVPTHQAIAEHIANMWRRRERSSLPVILLYGPVANCTHDIAAVACASVGLGLLALAADTVPSSLADLRVLVRLCDREAALSGSALLMDCDDDDHTDPSHECALNYLIERTESPLIVTSRERRTVKQRPVLSFEVGRPVACEQRAVWETALGDLAQRMDGQLDSLISHFSLSAPAIRSTAEDAKGERDAQSCYDALWEACRNHTRPRLEGLAQRIEPAAAWDDLVLPEAQKEILRDIVVHVRHRTKVYETWGFARKGSRGLGITALFAGASGTGKTMAAEVLAGELRLDLYRIDLSSVVSKYIGETEKNLRRVFDAAETGGALLLFDEADALFGKRSEVKDSHDRYANVEISYLLQRMECYRGLAILTTNMKSAVDPAFLRRIRFIVQFPFPDAAHRAEIWRRIFPSDLPTKDLHVDRLARLNVAGGNIRNIALSAAFLAADAQEKVNMSHALRAARLECAKLEKPLAEAEIAGWL